MLRLKLNMVEANDKKRLSKKRRTINERFFFRSKFNKMRKRLNKGGRPSSTSGTFFTAVDDRARRSGRRCYPSFSLDSRRKRSGIGSNSVDKSSRVGRGRGRERGRKKIRSGKKFYITKKTNKNALSSLVDTPVIPSMVKKRFDMSRRISEKHQNFLRMNKRSSMLFSYKEKFLKNGSNSVGETQAKNFRSYKECLLSNTVNWGRKTRKISKTDRIPETIKTEKSSKEALSNKISSDLMSHIHSENTHRSVEARAFDFYHDQFGIKSGQGKNLNIDLAKLSRKKKKRNHGNVILKIVRDSILKHMETSDSRGKSVDHEMARFYIGGESALLFEEKFKRCNNGLKKLAEYIS